MKLTYDRNEFYRAHLAKDPRFDGKFFVAVKTTMIYCRPICPARKAHLKNIEFFTHARAVADQTLVLDGTADFETTCRALLAIKGIGPWTVEYIAMRGLRDPNGFPESDLESQKKIVRLQLDPKKWAPWRAYAAILLWNIQLEHLITTSKSKVIIS